MVLSIPRFMCRVMGVVSTPFISSFLRMKWFEVETGGRDRYRPNIVGEDCLVPEFVPFGRITTKSFRKRGDTNPVNQLVKLLYAFRVDEFYGSAPRSGVIDHLRNKVTIVEEQPVAGPDFPGGLYNGIPKGNSPG